MTSELRACLRLFQDSPNPMIEAQLALERCAHWSAQILGRDDQRYPSCFHLLEDPPEFLAVIGSLDALHPDRCVSIVGAREASRRALEWVDREIPQYLDRAPHTIIVSGGARGIDQRAHAAALRKGKPTVVFLPSGFDAIYPSDLSEWLKPVIAAGGAFVSPYAPSQTIRRHHFEGRNRLIAALGRWLLVVEARARSGSVMTARLAGELSKPVLCLPSFPSEGWASGTLELGMNGGQWIRDATDLTMVDAVLLPSAAQRPDRSN